jgi:hypothetical protein
MGAVFEPDARSRSLSSPDRFAIIIRVSARSARDDHRNRQFQLARIRQNGLAIIAIEVIGSFFLHLCTWMETPWRTRQQSFPLGVRLLGYSIHRLPNVARPLGLAQLLPRIKSKLY